MQYGIPVRQDFAQRHHLAAVALLSAKIDYRVKGVLLALDIPGVGVLVYGGDIQLLSMERMAGADLALQEREQLVHVFHPGHAPGPFDMQRSVGGRCGLVVGVVGLR